MSTTPEDAARNAEQEAGTAAPAAADPFAVPLFHAPDLDELKAAAEAKKKQEAAERAAAEDENEDDGEVLARKRRRRRRGDADMELVDEEEDPNTVTKVRTPRLTDSTASDQVTSVKGSTRLEAKRQRRRESRATGRRRHGITEAEFLARRESVDRKMIVRQKDDRIQIGVLEDGVLAEHFVSKTQQDSLIGNVYVGKVQNVLPSMEAAFVDIGRGRNAVLYAGEVNWDAAGLDSHQPRRIEKALKSGDSVLVQVTKDPVGHKGARLTSQISLPGRFLVYVPGGSMTGISRKLPDTERARLKKILKDRLPDGAGVIVRTAAEGAAEEELGNDINRLRAQWEEIQSKSTSKKVLAPELLYQEPDLTIKTVRDVFNEDFTEMVVQGEQAWDNIEAYVTYVAPDLVGRLTHWTEDEDVFDHYRVEEQLAKALDRKVYLPSGGSLVIDRTEAMTVVDVNTGKFTGSGGNLEETVTKNNLEAAEEIVRQLRLRDIGGIIVIDFIDMVLESNRDLVLRRLVECLGRDRTKHQVAEVTSLGLVQMTRKRMGTGLLEVFSEPCEACDGRGVVVHEQPLKGRSGGHGTEHPHRDRTDRKRGTSRKGRSQNEAQDPRAEKARTALASIAAATRHDEDEHPAEAEECRAPANGPEETGEPGESKSAKKRKRRKRNKAAQQEAEQNGPKDPDLVLNIHGEVVSLPQGGDESEDDEEAVGEQGSFTLDSLSEAFDRKAPVAEAEPAEKDRGRGSQSGRGSSNRRGSRRADAPRTSGREGAEEARRAALEALDELSPGRRRGSRRSAESSADGAERSRGTKDRSERGSGSGRRAEGGQQSRQERRPSSEQASAGKTVSAPAEKTARAESAPAAEAPAPKRRRGRRAASSAGVGQSITTGGQGSAQGVTVTASAAQAPAAPAAEKDAPTMLGVGVKASEIKRAQ